MGEGLTHAPRRGWCSTECSLLQAEGRSLLSTLKEKMPCLGAGLRPRWLALPHVRALPALPGGAVHQPTPRDIVLLLFLGCSLSSFSSPLGGPQSASNLLLRVWRHLLAARLYYDPERVVSPYRLTSGNPRPPIACPQGLCGATVMEETLG